MQIGGPRIADLELDAGMLRLQIGQQADEIAGTDGAHDPELQRGLLELDEARGQLLRLAGAIRQASTFTRISLTMSFARVEAAPSMSLKISSSCPPTLRFDVAIGTMYSDRRRPSRISPVGLPASSSAQ
jgi:hypothetical protein